MTALIAIMGRKAFGHSLSVLLVLGMWMGLTWFVPQEHEANHNTPTPTNQSSSLLITGGFSDDFTAPLTPIGNLSDFLNFPYSRMSSVDEAIGQSIQGIFSTTPFSPGSTQDMTSTISTSASVSDSVIASKTASLPDTMVSLTTVTEIVTVVGTSTIVETITAMPSFGTPDTSSTLPETSQSFAATSPTFAYRLAPRITSSPKVETLSISGKTVRGAGRTTFMDGATTTTRLTVREIFVNGAWVKMRDPMFIDDISTGSVDSGAGKSIEVEAVNDEDGGAW